MKGEDVTQRTRRAPRLHAVIEAYSQTACALQALDHVHAAGDGWQTDFDIHIFKILELNSKHRM